VSQSTPRPTVMADVARRAGVSVMTVSRVLNRFPGVSDVTRRRVERAVDALGYQANTAARVLAGGRSHTLGVIAVESEQFGPSHVLFAIEAAAREAGHRLALVTVSSREDIDSVLGHLRTSHVDGVIAVAPVKPLVEAVTVAAKHLPLVVAGGDPTLGTPTVSIGQEQGGYLATKHLLELGHGTVHHVRGPKDWIDATGRRRGWSDALKDFRAPRPAVLTGDWGAKSGYAAGERLALDPDVTAIFAANDQMALGVMRALHDAGRRVPDDVSVVGFDDTPESGYFSPSLTTIRQNFADLGQRCVSLVLSLVEGDSLEEHPVVPPELILRESSGSVRRR